VRMDMKPWRKIIRRTEAKTEHSSVRGRTWTWWVRFKTTLSLECGHQKVVSGQRMDAPKYRVRCAECPQT